MAQKDTKKKFYNINNWLVWKRIKKKDIPTSCRYVKRKWVLKIKRNGVYWTRLVACGYSPFSGVDYMENYLLVSHYITFCLLMIAKMIYGLSAKIVHVETVILYWDLNKKIFMNIPEGLEGVPDQDAMKLQNCIHSLVKSSR